MRFAAKIAMSALSGFIATFSLGDGVATDNNVTLRPEATCEALLNPGMGLVYYQYSNRLWGYGSRTKPGDTLDWFPGANVIYMRLP